MATNQGDLENESKLGFGGSDWNGLKLGNIDMMIRTPDHPACPLPPLTGPHMIESLRPEWECGQCGRRFRVIDYGGAASQWVEVRGPTK